jgi:hypothetical protein
MALTRTDALLGEPVGRGDRQSHRVVEDLGDAVLSCLLRWRVTGSWRCRPWTRVARPCRSVPVGRGAVHMVGQAVLMPERARRVAEDRPVDVPAVRPPLEHKGPPGKVDRRAPARTRARGRSP